MMEKYLEVVKKIVLQEVNGTTRVFLFGSRAYGDFKPFSDADVGLLDSEGISPAVIASIENNLNESCVPYKVDLVDFSKVSEKFKDEAMKKIVVWQD